MSGICGVVNLDGAPVAPDVLRAMAEKAAHRGLIAVGETQGETPAVDQLPAAGGGGGRRVQLDLPPPARDIPSALVCCLQGAAPGDPLDLFLDAGPRIRPGARCWTGSVTVDRCP